MLSEATVSRVNAYWAEYFGCAPATLFSGSAQIIPHGPGLADYAGIYAHFRGGEDDGRAVISLPPERLDALRALLPAGPATPASLSAAFLAHSTAIIGPAYLGYAEAVAAPAHSARVLDAADAAAVRELESACDGTEWEHGGSAPLDGCPLSGVFVSGRLAALAGYEVWGGSIAHISIITHPGFRGRGLGRSAVARLAARALSAGLVPQYRTLGSNLASVRVAESLGFCRYATSLAIRLPSGDEEFPG